MTKAHVPLFISILMAMVVVTACIPWDPNFDTLRCKNGIIKLTPSDSSSPVCWQSDYICGVSFDDESKYTKPKYDGKTVHYSSNGSFQTIASYTFADSTDSYDPCTWLPSENRGGGFTDYDITKCGYVENPDYVVIYCNENDELTISDKTCAEYIDSSDGTFTP